MRVPESNVEKIMFTMCAGLLLLAQTGCVHPKPWPDKKETQATLMRCSKILSGAVDMDKVQADAVRITNAVMKADVLRLSKEAKEVCDQAARLMTNSGFQTSSWNGGYTGAFSDTQENGFTFSCYFASANGPVVGIEQKGKIRSHSQFYDDGKLKTFYLSEPNSEGLNLYENGKIRSCVVVETITSTNEIDRSIYFNTNGGFVIRHLAIENKNKSQK